MHKTGYYSSGEFAKMAHITKKTIRYYDEHDILKPSYLSPSGARFYSDKDLAKLSQILLFKYLGFSLDDIKEMTVNDSDYHLVASSLNLQLKLIEDKIEQMQQVSQAIKSISMALELSNEHLKKYGNQKESSINWENMLDLIQTNNLDYSLKNQYLNSSNIASRINLHELYSHNKQGWFPWVYEQCNIYEGMNILEVGCGDGSLWRENISSLPLDIHIKLSDISEGMLRDARRSIGQEDSRFEYDAADCCHLSYENDSFDLVIANHLLFYCDDLLLTCSQILRVLKPGGTFICSTYGSIHMKEINDLVTEFDNRIILSADKLYERFGRDNGVDILSPFFKDVKWVSYEDYLNVTDAGDLISYILSCHGNQNQYILEHFKEFRSFVKNRTNSGFHITKDAGIFICKKNK